MVISAPTLRTFAGTAALDQIEHVLGELWAQHPHVPHDVRVRLGIAVGEIAANIIEHATKGLDRLVELQMWAHVRDADVLVTFADDGIPTPIHLPRPEMPPELAESGRGLPLAHAVLNDLTYHRADEVNHWTLVSQPF